MPAVAPAVVAAASDTAAAGAPAVAAVAACPSQSRIENAQTSGTLSETIGMTRNIDPKTDRERGGAARAAKDVAQASRGGKADGTRSRYSMSYLALVVHCWLWCGELKL